MMEVNWCLSGKHNFEVDKNMMYIVDYEGFMQ